MNYFSLILNNLLAFLYEYSATNSELVSKDINTSVFLGKTLTTVFKNRPYVSFYKIPYAVPPVKTLRFKPPEEFKHAPNKSYDYSTPHYEAYTNGVNEDCLYLSLHVPASQTADIARFPVIVWIHESSNYHGPDFFIDEGVLVVIVSYRTCIFGFLNTEDDFAPGNMGAKDILLALRWIQQNIADFGGDPNKVTLAGSGSGGNIVASFLLSPAAEGLFSRVIIQSGSALSPADYKSYNFEVANKLYWNLNGPFQKFNRSNLYEILHTVAANKLLLASRELFDSSEIRDVQRLINSFGISIEKSKNKSFISKHPVEIYKRKMSNNDVEVLMGFNSLEGLYKMKGLAENPKLLQYLNYNFQYVLPFEGIPDVYGSNRYKKIMRKIMEFYFINGTISHRSVRRYAKYISDQIIYPLLRHARLHTSFSCNDVYLYRFSFKGSLNVGWKKYLRNLNTSISGATFSDEICYLFKCKSHNDFYNLVTSERELIKKMTRLWANFIKYGNPTPEYNDTTLGSIKWEPLHNGHSFVAMNLCKKMQMRIIPENKRVEFWDHLKDEFFK